MSTLRRMLFTLTLGVMIALVAVPTLAELEEPASAQRRTVRRGARGRRVVRRGRNARGAQEPPAEAAGEGEDGEEEGGEEGQEGAEEGQAGAGASGATSPAAQAAQAGAGASGAAARQTPAAGGAPSAGAAAAGTAAPPAEAAGEGEAGEANDPGPAPPDLSPIRQDYVALMDELVEARSLVSALGTELFRTRVRVVLQDRTGGRQTMARFSARLDGAPIHESGGSVPNAGEGTQIFEGSAAPGPHVISLEIEQRARANEEYRYTQRDSYRFQVARERLTEITIVLEDDSDIAGSFQSSGEGRFETRTRLRVATRALPAGSGGGGGGGD